MHASWSVDIATAPLWQWPANSPPICWLWTRAVGRFSSVLRCPPTQLRACSRKRAKQKLWRYGNPAYTARITTSPQLRLRLLPNCQRSTGRSSLSRGLGRGVLIPDAPHRLFRGRPVYPNSIFVDGAAPLFPQMDVWPSCCYGPRKRSGTVRKSNHYHHSASGVNPDKRRRIYVFT